jgi:hypothetical protein
VIGWNQSVVGLARDEVGSQLDEVVVKWLIIEEDPVIVVFVVESVLNLAN